MKSKGIPIFIALLIGASAFNQQKPSLPGKEIFESKCSKCHGKDGTKGLFGAKNLQRSNLSDIEYFTIISNGKKIMPTWKHRLTAEQINLVIDYIKELRNNKK